jgi:hypothetical protein
VALSGDGETVVVGAPSIVGGTNGKGHVHVLRYDSVNGWVRLGSEFNGENDDDYLVMSVPLIDIGF